MFSGGQSNCIGKPCLGIWIAVDKAAVRHFTLAKSGLDRSRRMIFAVKSKSGFVHHGWDQGTIEIKLKGKRRKQLIVELIGQRKGKATLSKHDRCGNRRKS